MSRWVGNQGQPRVFANYDEWAKEVVHRTFGFDIPDGSPSAPDYVEYETFLCEPFDEDLYRLRWERVAELCQWDRELTLLGLEYGDIPLGAVPTTEL